MFICHTPVQVRYAETDMMGFAYHANYLVWFEIGRTDLLRERGLPYLQLEEEGFRLPVLEAHTRYHKPALYDDELIVETTAAPAPSLRIRLDYRLLRGEEILATGHTLHVFINPDGRPVKPPPAFRRAFETP